MARIEIKKYDVMSVAKISGITGAIFGFIIGIFAALIGGFAGAMAGGAVMGAGLGLLAIIAFPILYGIMCFISGAIGVLIYNFVAEKIGGIVFES